MSDNIQHVIRRLYDLEPNDVLQISTDKDSIITFPGASHNWERAVSIINNGEPYNVVIYRETDSLYAIAVNIMDNCRKYQGHIKNKSLIRYCRLLNSPNAICLAFYHELENDALEAENKASSLVIEQVTTLCADDNIYSVTNETLENSIKRYAKELNWLNNFKDAVKASMHELGIK